MVSQPLAFRISEGEEGSEGHGGAGQKGLRVVLHDLEIGLVSIWVVIGDKVLETAHTVRVVHHDAVFVGLGHVVDCVASAVFVLVCSDNRVHGCSLGQVVGPVVHADVGALPLEARVGEGEDVAGAVHLVLVAREEVDAAALTQVAATLALPALVVCRDDRLGASEGQRASNSDS